MYYADSISFQCNGFEEERGGEFRSTQERKKTKSFLYGNMLDYISIPLSHATALQTVISTSLFSTQVYIACNINIVST